MALHCSSAGPTSERPRGTQGTQGLNTGQAAVLTLYTIPHFPRTTTRCNASNIREPAEASASTGCKGNALSMALQSSLMPSNPNTIACRRAGFLLWTLGPHRSTNHGHESLATHRPHAFQSTVHWLANGVLTTPTWPAMSCSTKGLKASSQFTQSSITQLPRLLTTQLYGRPKSHVITI